MTKMVTKRAAAPHASPTKEHTLPKQTKPDDVRYKELTLSVDDLKRTRFQKNVAERTGPPCCCDREVASTFVPTENENVTECVLSSLLITNGENIISLSKNYVTEHHLSFSSVSMRAIISFLVNATNTRQQKFRLEDVLKEQLRTHPACCPYNVDSYDAFMLAKHEEFAGLTVLEYVLAKIEQAVCSPNVDYVITSNRVSRRQRRPTVARDECASGPKKARRPAVYVDSDEEDAKGADNVRSAPEADFVPRMENVLNFLTHILAHNLGSALKHDRDPSSTMVARLAFRFGNLIELDSALMCKIYEIYKNCKSWQLRTSVSKLLQIIAETCVYLDQGGVYKPLRLGHCCRSLVNEFCVSVFGEEPSDDSFHMVSVIQPEWFRYHVAHYVVEKMVSRKMAVGFVGLENILRVVWEKVKQDMAASSKVLKNVNNIQFSNIAGDEKRNQNLKDAIDDTELIYASKSKQIQRQFKSNNSAESRNKEVDNTNIRQLLSPTACKMMFIFIDSTMKIIKTADSEHRAVPVKDYSQIRPLLTEDYVRLQKLLNKLCAAKKLPRELKLLGVRLNDSELDLSDPFRTSSKCM